MRQALGHGFGRESQVWRPAPLTNFAPGLRYWIRASRGWPRAQRAGFRAASGDAASALQEYNDLLAAMRAAGLDAKSMLEDAVDLSNVYGWLIGLYRDPEAEARVTAERLALWKDWSGRRPDNI